ncbi:RNA polymerase B [Rhizophlyctis rosea]|nr:RNA polymerase B [Rhizophlyctis rosea]
MMSRRGAEDPTDAAYLQFGPAYQNEKALLISEAKGLLELRLKNDLPVAPEKLDVFNKTFNYCNKFDFYSGESIKAVKGFLQHPKDPADENKALFHAFEQAQLANLSPDSVDEARSLIHSLNNKPDDVIQSVIDELSSYKRSG